MGGRVEKVATLDVGPCIIERIDDYNEPAAMDTALARAKENLERAIIAASAPSPSS